MQRVHRLQVAWKIQEWIRKSVEDDLRDVLKQQNSNITEMTSGLYVSIQSFCDVFTVSQTALAKLIVITNCKDF